VRVFPVKEAMSKKSITLGQPRFPALRAVKISDDVFRRHILVAGGDETLRRSHMVDILLQQTRRGGDYIFLTTEAGTAAVEHLSLEATGQGRDDDFFAVDWRSAPGTAAGAFTTMPDSLKCIVLPSMREGHSQTAVAIWSLLSDLCQYVSGHSARRRVDDPALLVVIDDVALLNQLVSPAGPDCQFLAPLVHCVEQARACNTGFILGAATWATARRGPMELMQRNAYSHLLHPGASNSDIDLAANHAQVHPEMIHARLNKSRFVLAQPSGLKTGVVPGVVLTRNPRAVPYFMPGARA
jgi:hypothetical protein